MLLPRFSRTGSRGFTLLELVVVMTVLALLTTVGIVGYKHHLKRVKESVLREDLFQLNHALECYKADRGKYPSSITQLRELQYLREIPADPMTQSKDTWIGDVEQQDPDNPDADVGIWKIRSGSNDIGDDGIAYNEWAY